MQIEFETKSYSYACRYDGHHSIKRHTDYTVVHVPIHSLYLPVKVDPGVLEEVDVHGSVLVKPTPTAHPGVFLAAANRRNISCFAKIADLLQTAIYWSLPDHNKTQLTHNSLDVLYTEGEFGMLLKCLCCSISCKCCYWICNSTHPLKHRVIWLVFLLVRLNINIRIHVCMYIRAYLRMYYIYKNTWSITFINGIYPTVSAPVLQTKTSLIYIVCSNTTC